MVQRLTLLIVVSFVLTGCPGLGDAVSFTYKLHEPRNSQEFSTLHTMPAGALLVVSKRILQPKQIWTLRRIAAWDTSQPREDELEVDVGPNDEPLDWSLQADRHDRTDQLLMDPGGNYLVVRLSQDADAWSIAGFWHAPPPFQGRGESAKRPRSVLNIIDLHGFKLLRRVEVSDPLLAAGDVGFSPTGAFVVSGLQAYTSAGVGGKMTYTGQYAVETLTLPGLKPATVCSYSIVTKRYSAQTTSSPEERRRIAKDEREESERKRDQELAADKACGPQLAALGFSSLKDVGKNLDSFGMQQYRGEHLGSVPPQSPWGCQFEDLTGDLKYALFDCDESRVQLTFLFWYRGFRLFHLEDGKQIMDLKLPHSPQFSGVLATKSGVTYVVLLRDGAELKGYRVP